MNGPIFKPPVSVKPLGIACLALLAAGCHRAPAGYSGAMPPPAVNIVIVQPRDLPITAALPGRIDAERVANVNARVDGVVLRREFTQGAEVTNGQALYRIDPAPYQAQLESARASRIQAQSLMNRYKPLVGINAVSHQNYENAVSAAAQAKAAQEVAAINLSYCSVTAPISGRIGPALVTEGTLVSQAAATPMAVVQQMDPIYFDFTESSVDVLKLHEQIESGRLHRSGEPQVTLQLPDGTTYPHEGKLLFQDVTVDPSSGMVTLRAEFPNPDRVLLPGMFAVGTVREGIEPNTILIPQRAVVIDPTGAASVMVVNATTAVESRAVELGAAAGVDWVVQSGLKSGDRVIVDGLQKAHPGMTVNPTVVKAPEENSTAVAAGE